VSEVGFEPTPPFGDQIQCKNWIIRSALVRGKAHCVGQTCGGRDHHVVVLG